MEREELEGLWNGSQEELRGLRRRLEDTEKQIALLEQEKDASPAPPLPVSPETTNHQLPQSKTPPARHSGHSAPGGADRFDALANKLLFMSDRLSRIDPPL